MSHLVVSSFSCNDREEDAYLNLRFATHMISNIMTSYLAKSNFAHLKSDDRISVDNQFRLKRTFCYNAYGNFPGYPESEKMRKQTKFINFAFTAVLDLFPFD